MSSMHSMDGKTVIVTGANNGIGYETAKGLAARGARVIMACRNVGKANAARNAIVTATGNSDVTVCRVDLSSLKSVREFCQHIIDTENRLDVLVNNAGIGAYGDKVVTDDGLEFLMATNHFGPFLLTNLLLDILKRSTPSRIVIVSSILHKYGKIDLDNFNSERRFNKNQLYELYNNSKLANVLFTKELTRRLEGTGVTANCLHPGAVNTSILENSPAILRYAAASAKCFLKTPAQGAKTSIYCAVSDDLTNVSGKYFSNCKEAKVSKKAQDVEMALRLWEYTKEKVGLK